MLLAILAVALCLYRLSLLFLQHHASGGLEPVIWQGAPWIFLQFTGQTYGDTHLHNIKPLTNLA